MRASVILPALSALHMLLLLLARRGEGWAAWSSWWAASGLAVFLFLLARDLLAGRRMPDRGSSFAWGASFALEFQALSPPLADTRFVPVVLFPIFAWYLPRRRSFLYAAASLSWIAFSPDGVPADPGRTLSNAGIAAFGFFGAMLLRRGAVARTEERKLVREAIEETRSLLISGEEGRGAAEKGGGGSGTLERHRLLRSREDLMEGVRRILEGILPATGADLVLFVIRSPEPGREYSTGAAASRSGDPGALDLAIPGNYVPVAEALTFRRTYYAEGRGAKAFGVGTGARKPPTGVACAPAAAEGRMEGAVLAIRYAGERWTEPVTHLLETAAFLAGREIERAKRQYNAERYDAQLRNLVQKIAEIAESGGETGASPRKEVCRASTEQARRQLGGVRSFFVETGRDGGKGRIAWESTDVVSREYEEWIGIGETYLEWVQKQGVHRIFTAEQAGSARFNVLPESWRAAGVGCHLLVPVPSLGGFRGVMVCESGPERVFDARDAKTVRDILDVMKMGISHALYVEDLEKRATNDGLTGLLNRKTFQNRLANVLSRIDGRYPCVVAMLDIDHFKRINDIHGHPAGDEVLRKVSGIINKTVRKMDMAGRYGGEEFILYLHDTDEPHAFLIAERLRMKIRETRFLFGGKEVGATASLGIACYPGHGKDAESLIRHADAALYESKRSGRDRTTVHIKR